jgi:uncharacterized peroxidase-related enzyme
MTSSFLAEPPVSPAVQAVFDEEIEEDGYVSNAARLWVHQPDTLVALFGLMAQTFERTGLSLRQRGILVVATASTLGDSYCSLAWGGKLGQAADPALAAAVVDGSDTGLTDQEKALAMWARQMVRDPNATTPADVQTLRQAGLDDGQIFAVTTFVALRLAFATVNDALGAQPDAELGQTLPPEVLSAVTFGRAITPG